MGELASKDEPLVLADGTKIDPATGRQVRDQSYIQVPTRSEAQQEVTKARKRLADLPAPPKTMNAVSAVVYYKLMGLTDSEVSQATGIDSAQVGRMLMSELYTEVKSEIVKAVLEEDTDDVRRLIQTHQRDALNSLVSLVHSSDEKVALGAANSVLDRGGNRAADIVEHRHRVEGGLTIEYVERDQRDKQVALDVEYEEVDDD